MAPLSLGPNGCEPLSRDVGTEMLVSEGLAAALLASSISIPSTTGVPKSVPAFLIFDISEHGILNP